MLPRDFAQAANHVAAILAFEDSGGPRGDAQLIGNRESDTPPAVIETQHSPRQRARSAGQRASQPALSWKLWRRAQFPSL